MPSHREGDVRYLERFMRTAQLHRKMSANETQSGHLVRRMHPCRLFFPGWPDFFPALLRVQNTEKPVEQKIMICNGDGGGRGADYANFMACCLLISAEHRIGARATGPRVA